MIKKKQQVNKVVRQDKYVWECVLCQYRVISVDKPKQCSSCKNENTFVINGSFIVTKGD